MSYRIAITRAAAKQVKALPKSARQRVRAAVEALADEPRPHGLKTLDSKKKVYRVRAGSYRVVYQIQDARLVVLVVRVGDRKEVYKRLTELLKATPPPED